MKIDERFMKRAIELARHGRGNTSPNPMVGAVVVHDGMIIGEGYHRKCGSGHAEVNAIAAVKDKALLKDSTIYVTLEPCSHYGKTPPCAKLIIDSGIPRVVVGSLDPSKKVNGKGIAMLRDAGVEVVTGVLEEECEALNPAFFTVHRLHRPLVTLKWAQSADGFMDRLRTDDEQPEIFSTRLTSTLTHRLRTLHDAIMVGSGTWRADRPSLTARLWPGQSPARVVAGHGLACPSDVTILGDGDDVSISSYLDRLLDQGITSVLVEGGARLLQSFIDSGLWDYARVEISPAQLRQGVKAPSPGILPEDISIIGGNSIQHYRNRLQESLKTPKKSKYHSKCL